MWFYYLMFVCNLLIPFIMILAGRFMKKCPMDINTVVGYRTRRSMINYDTWEFANRYCGKIWLRIGFVLLLISILVQIPLIGFDEEVIGIATMIIETVQLVLLLGSIFFVEKALKYTFDETGKRL